MPQKRGQQTVGLGPNPALFLNHLQAKNSIYLFKWLKTNQKKSNPWWYVKIMWIPITVSINKVLLDPSRIRMFMCGLWLLLRYNSKVE